MLFIHIDRYRYDDGRHYLACFDAYFFIYRLSEGTLSIECRIDDIMIMTVRGLSARLYRARVIDQRPIDFVCVSNRLCAWIRIAYMNEYHFWRRMETHVRFRLCAAKPHRAQTRQALLSTVLCCAH